MPNGTVLVLGASSSIARNLALRLGQRGYTLHLASRDREDLNRLAQDLAVRLGVPVATSTFEATDYVAHPGLIETVAAGPGGLQGLVLAFGELGDQQEGQSDFEFARRIIDSNYTGAVSVLTPAANLMERQGQGFIIGISSVAGDRGRQSNYLYGSAKGALTIFLSGLRNRLSKRGVRVLTVKPGFTDTKMTFGKPKMFLVASPEAVAEAIMRGLESGRDEIYVPFFWAHIMRIIRNLPEAIFKRMKL